MGDGRQTAACRITHETQAGQVDERPGQRQHARRIGCEIAAEAEFFAREKHRRAVIPDRPADQNQVAGGYGLEAQA